MFLMQYAAIAVGAAGAWKGGFVVAAAAAAFANADAMVLIDENNAWFTAGIESHGFDGVAVAHYAAGLALKFDAEVFGLGLRQAWPWSGVGLEASVHAVKTLHEAGIFT